MSSFVDNNNIKKEKKKMNVTYLFCNYPLVHKYDFKSVQFLIFVSFLRILIIRVQREQSFFVCEWDWEILE